MCINFYGLFPRGIFGLTLFRVLLWTRHTSASFGEYWLLSSMKKCSPAWQWCSPRRHGLKVPRGPEKSLGLDTDVLDLGLVWSGLLISIIAIDSDTIGDTFRVLLSVLAILFSMVPLSIIAVLLQSIVNNHASDKFENDKLIKHIVLTRC